MDPEFISGNVSRITQDYRFVKYYGVYVPSLRRGVYNSMMKPIAKIPFKKLVVASLLLNILTSVFVLTIKNRLPPEVPLFYGLPIGEGQLATSISLVIPAVISSLIIVINVALTPFLQEDFLKKTLILAATVSALFSAITTIKIVFLVGSF